MGYNVVKKKYIRYIRRVIKGYLYVVKAKSENKPIIKKALQ